MVALAAAPPPSSLFTVPFHDGVLRAFVGAGYTAIDDHRVFDRLARVLGPRAGDFRFVRETLTDRTSQYVAVSQEDVDLSGNGHPDLHRHGFLIVNSEVGSRALGIIEHIFRLICSNGLASDADARRHTDAVLVAYRQEPEATRFGLVQAITRAAQGVGAEDRLALETLAGTLVVEQVAA